MNAQMLLQSFAGGDDEKTYIEDVFSTYLYTGNGTTQTITNGIDLAGKGGLVWCKNRSGSTYYSHQLNDTVRGASQVISTNSTAASANYSLQSVSSFNSNGYSIGNNGDDNASLTTYASWTFRNSPKFFKCATVTKSAGSNATVDLSSLGTVGMVTVKRTDAAGDWYTWHRSLPAGQLMYLNQTAAASTLGHITVSGTTLTLVNGVIADGAYVVYAWAHDPSQTGIIQCGSFTTDASGNATVNLGWEPQFVLMKCSNSSSSWLVTDTMRGMPVGSGAQSTAYLRPDVSNNEKVLALNSPTSTGFNSTWALGGDPNTYIYLAIRRGPMRVPTDGTKVFKPLTRTGTGTATTVTGVGFAPDMVMPNNRGAQGAPSGHFDRLRGAKQSLRRDASTTEVAFADSLLSFDQDGFTAGVDLNSIINGSAGYTYINWAFRRSPGFFDIVCDTGTGSAHAINHSLTVAPELIIRKSRSATTQWEVWHSALSATEKLVLNSTAGKATDATAFGTLPTATQFYVGASSNTNASAATYVTYLFATCPGVSKVGYYTGNGTSLTVECGFSTGARFILAKSIDDAGDSFIWDSARGIVAANDPHLSLNTTAAEVTTDDSVDPYAGGFIVNQNTATNINISGKRYIFIAIA